MRIINIQDGVVKSSLVQQAQQRPAEVERVRDAANLTQNQELARRADEVTPEVNKAEHDAIRDDQQRREQERRRRRRRSPRADAPAPTSETRDGKGEAQPPARAGGLDITV